MIWRERSYSFDVKSWKVDRRVVVESMADRLEGSEDWMDADIESNEGSSVGRAVGKGMFDGSAMPVGMAFWIADCSSVQMLVLASRLRLYNAME